MRYIFAILLLFFTTNLYAQNLVLPAVPKVVVPEKLKTPNSEVEDFILFLQNLSPDRQQYIRAFTTYAIPKELQEEAVLQVSFLIHSMVGISDTEENSGTYYPLARAKYKPEVKNWDGIEISYIQQVPGSTTLYWIDIRDYNWSEQSWENITKYDGYMVEPIIAHPNNGLLRLIAGNALVRADWFIFHASQTVAQTDLVKTNVPIYRELLYSKTKSPKSVSEFKKVWGLRDIETSRKLGNEYGTLVTKSKDVARHNRFLFGYRTEIGWLYQSYDVKSEQGKRDYLDNFYEFGGKPPNTFDGGEIFSSNLLQLQVYDLYDAEEKLVDFADTTIVRHLSDILGDTRVGVPHSCFDCHSSGPIVSENTIAEFLRNNGKLYLKSKADQLRIDRAFYNKKFEESIEEHQLLFTKALNKVNGLNPDDNVRTYFKLIKWYNTPVSLEQAAIECGETPENFKQKIKKGLQEYNNKLPGRAALLLQTGEPIPRAIWEAPNTDGIPGTFQSTMIIINGLTKVTTTIEYLPDVIIGCHIYSGGTNVIREVKIGERIAEFGEVKEGYVFVTLEDGTKGWILEKNIAKKK